ncbi:MAG TPA: hypothetical protein P5555_02700 [Candidatus Paceibacterota bacterium]|nr:hypothetical protein [Verrucomicrobiota bacterium]HRZ44083.1 hypothetical protein [Candidatus Paceibacterota bacterium]
MKRKAFRLGAALVAATVFAGCASTPQPPAVASSGAMFQMRLVADAPSSNTTEMAIVHTTGSMTHREIVQVENAVLFDQTALKSAQVQHDPNGQPQIGIQFTESGRKRFAQVTRENIGKRLAIVIDGQVYSAPRIMTEISGGKGLISGSFSQKEAADLAAKINGSLKR